MATKLLRILVCITLLSPVAASATLIGNNITIDWLYPDLGTTYASDNVLVGAGTEISCPSGGHSLCSGFIVSADIDLDADSISLFVTGGSSSWAPGAFNGYRFSDLSLGGPWSSVSLSTTFGALDSSRYSFDGSTLLVNMEGFAANQGDYFTFTLLNDRQVPEPATLALIGLGLLGLGRRGRAAV